MAREATRQNEILGALVQYGEIAITEPEDSPAAAAAYRRAAYVLRDRGQIELRRQNVLGRSRLVARMVS